MHDVFITGFGVVSPMGNTPEEMWEKCLKSEKGYGPITRFDTKKYKAKQAGEIHNFDIKKIAKNPKYLRLPRVSQFALAAAIRAMEDAQLDIRNRENRIGLIFGTSNGPTEATETIYNNLIHKGARGVDPLLFQETVFNASASHISIFFGIKGPTLALPMGTASGGFAIDYALNLLRTGKADAVLVGASDEHTEVTHRAFEALKTISPNNDKEETCCPFDKTRNGGIISEGAVFMVIENKKSLENRKKPPKTIYGKITSSAITNDAYKAADLNETGCGLIDAMNQSLNKANKKPQDIDAVMSYGFSHPKLDHIEGVALQTVFEGVDVEVTNIKGSTGETLGPSVLFNIMFSTLVFKHNVLPPMTNFNESDDDIKLNWVTSPKEKVCNTILTTYYYFSGMNGSLVLEKV
jgi:3-oxoacyl-[acyl-carrier-protein] synthase II